MELRVVRNLFVKGIVQVKQYGYRTAHVAHPIIKLETIQGTPEEQEHIRSFLKELAKRARADMNNHIVYEFTFDDGAELSMMYSDHNIIIGTGVREEPW